MIIFLYVLISLVFDLSFNLVWIDLVHTASEYMIFSSLYSNANMTGEAICALDRQKGQLCS